MLITITKEDTEKGVRASFCNCALALGIKRATGKGFVFIFNADDGKLLIGDDEQAAETCFLPAAAIRWRDHFDNGAKGLEVVKRLGLPFEFELPMPKAKGLFD